MGGGSGKSEKVYAGSKNEQVMYLLEFHKEAEKEYNEAYVWYGLQQEGLEERFRLAINEAVIQIQKNPEYFG